MQSAAYSCFLGLSVSKGEALAPTLNMMRSLATDRERLALSTHFTAVSLFPLRPPSFQRSFKLIFLESFPKSFPVVLIFPLSTSLHWAVRRGKIRTTGKDFGKDSRKMSLKDL